MEKEEAMRVLFPTSVLQNRIDELFKYYVSQYGKENSSLIRNRLSNIIYIFNSPPDITYKFILDNQDLPIDEKYISNIEKQAINYNLLNKSLNVQLMKDLCESFYYYHNISSNDVKFDIEQILFLVTDMCNNKNDYIKQITELGIKPIEDEHHFLNFMENCKKLVYDKENNLKAYSLWGQSIKNSLLKMGIGVSDNDLACLLDYSEDGWCRAFDNGRKDPIVIITIPILQRYLEGMDVDRIFLHEFRHSIEIKDINRIGLYDKSGVFRSLNETRTEGCAIEDNKNINTIFSKRTLKKWCDFYGKIYYHNKDFFDTYNSILNSLAFSNDIEKMFKIFGEKDITQYDIILNSIYNDMVSKYVNNQEVIITDNNLCKKQIKKLDRNIRKNHFDIK